MANGTIRLNLKLIASVDFRHGIPHHYDELRKKRMLRDVADDEVILLVSQTGRQMAFVFREHEIHSRSGDTVKALAHYRIQLDRHTSWSPLMLSEYANAAGIELIGIKRFEEYITKGASS